MRKFGDWEPKVVAVTAAMSTGTGLKRFGNMFPERFFDVGIAEEHAVTFAAGLALGGMIPVVAVYLLLCRELLIRRLWMCVCRTCMSFLLLTGRDW